MKDGKAGLGTEREAMPMLNLYVRRGGMGKRNRNMIEQNIDKKKGWELDRSTR
jgi:hypothetical protein